MIRKLWLELRLLFTILPIALILFTLEYTWAFQHANIMYYSDKDGYGLVMSPVANSAKEIESFLKEHPQGLILSLQNSPHSYFLGFDGIARTLLPFMVVALCAGGILSEKNNGTASYSLSLPVSRSSWIWSRAGALLFLSFLTALISCAVTYALAQWMGIAHGLSWLVTEPVLLTLGAAPWIGVSLYIQSLFSGRFDPASEAIIPVAVTALLVFLTDIFLPNSTVNGFGNPYLLLMDAAESVAHPTLWKPLLATGIVGITSLLLAVRRFERMDF